MADAFMISIGNPSRMPRNTPLMSNITLDAATDQWETVFQVPEAVVITKVGFRYGARTGTPPTYKVSLQGVGATGNPDGTIKGSGSPASKTFTPPADTTWDGTWQWITLDNPYTCVRGEYLSIVIAYESGTIDSGNASSFTGTITNIEQSGNCYNINNQAGSRTKATTFPTFGYASASKSYGFPIANVSNSTFNSSSTPDERAIRFTIPTGWMQSYKVVGVRWCMAGAGNAHTMKLCLYDSDGTTILQDVTLDSDITASTSATLVYQAYFDEATLATLLAGTQYRLSFVPQSSGAPAILGLVVPLAADRTAWPGGTAFAASSRTDGGAWTDDDTLRYWAELILEDITTGGGGIKVPMGFEGGFRG
jgi:hypothetical protein